MSSIDGFGLLYYGWRHRDDGTATATKWIAVCWLPVFPCYREHLQVLTDFKNDKIESQLGGLMVGQRDSFRIIERLPLSAKEVWITLAKTYLGLPLCYLVPMIIAGIIAKGLGLLGLDGPNIVIPILGVGSAVGMFNFLLQIVRAIRRSRGWQRRPSAG